MGDIMNYYDNSNKRQRPRPRPRPPYYDEADYPQRPPFWSTTSPWNASIYTTFESFGTTYGAPPSLYLNNLLAYT